MEKFKEGDILYIKSNVTRFAYIAPFYRITQPIINGRDLILTHGYLDEHNNFSKQNTVLISESGCKEIRLATIDEITCFIKQLALRGLSFNRETFKYEKTSEI